MVVRQVSFLFSLNTHAELIFKKENNNYKFIYLFIYFQFSNVK